MKKILTIIGARPQIIKAAALSRAIKNEFSKELQEVIVHTGQHYDASMSGVFFEEMDIPQPAINLGVGSGSHGVMTGRMLEHIENVLLQEQPDALLVYGDTNSTLAGALAAAKLFVPVVHVEAGLRSFNKSMPEEINRITCDHCASLLFTPTLSGVANLKKEGFNTDNLGSCGIDNPFVFHAGDVMFDNSLFFAEKARLQSKILENLNLSGKKFALATVHRDHNTDNPKKLEAIFSAFIQLVEDPNFTIVLPLHPRTEKTLNLNQQLKEAIEQESRIRLIPPVSFLDMIQLESNASIVITDSGGVQKESFFFRKPCVILRPETEWVELIDNGNAAIADAQTDVIVNTVHNLLAKKDYTYPEYYGDGQAALFICKQILKHL